MLLLNGVVRVRVVRTSTGRRGKVPGLTWEIEGAG